MRNITYIYLGPEGAAEKRGRQQQQQLGKRLPHAVAAVVVVVVSLVCRARETYHVLFCRVFLFFFFLFFFCLEWNSEQQGPNGAGACWRKEGKKSAQPPRPTSFVDVDVDLPELQRSSGRRGKEGHSTRVFHARPRIQGHCVGGRHGSRLRVRILRYFLYFSLSLSLSPSLTAACKGLTVHPTNPSFLVGLIC